MANQLYWKVTASNYHKISCYKSPFLPSILLQSLGLLAYVAGKSRIPRERIRNSQTTQHEWPILTSFILPSIDWRACFELFVPGITTSDWWLVHTLLTANDKNQSQTNLRKKKHRKKNLLADETKNPDVVVEWKLWLLTCWNEMLQQYHQLLLSQLCFPCAGFIFRCSLCVTGMMVLVCWADIAGRAHDPRKTLHLTTALKKSRGVKLHRPTGFYTHPWANKLF